MCNAGLSFPFKVFHQSIGISVISNIKLHVQMYHSINHCIVCLTISDVWKRVGSHARLRIKFGL
jgi:hypothetical protein